MSTIVCLDFGTSLTKVAASLDGDMPFAIPIGAREGDPLREYAIHSSLLFSRDGKIYFGRRAIEMSFAPSAEPQRRLDSLKRWLISADMRNLDRTPLPSNCNGTGEEFTVADCLRLHFAHVFDLVHGYLTDEYAPEVLDAAVYRFTRPVFGDAQARWVDDQMTSAIAAALVLQGQWRNNPLGECDARAARRALDATRLETAPVAIVERPGLEEPIAAGVVQLSERYSHRSLAAIVDIGAGTTDMAVFVAIQPDRGRTIDRVKVLGPPLSIDVAGDYLDGVLREMIEEGCDFTLSERDRIEIDLNIRRWKEDIFNFQETVPTLSGGRVLRRILLHRLERSQKYLAMQERLVRGLLEVFESAARWLDFFATASQFPHSEIEVVPSGGGASLPIFSAIDRIRWESRPSRRILRVSVKRPVPDASWGYAEGFSQLTVALGGAFEERPRVIGAAP